MKLKPEYETLFGNLATVKPELRPNERSLESATPKRNESDEKILPNTSTAPTQQADDGKQGTQKSDTSIEKDGPK